MSSEIGKDPRELIIAIAIELLPEKKKGKFAEADLEKNVLKLAADLELGPTYLLDLIRKIEDAVLETYNIDLDTQGTFNWLEDYDFTLAVIASHISELLA